jgi:endonuclease/exonuclease/phosphatase family metal-dependent hydrolase
MVPLRVASYNTHKCIGTDGRFDPSRIADVIHSTDADIIALQEADARFGKKQGLLDTAYLKELAGYRFVSEQPAGSLSHGWHGNVILYRSGEVKRVKRIKLPCLEPRGAVAVDFSLHGKTLHFIAAHFGLLRLSRHLQAKAITSFMLKNPNDHMVVVGDFNEWRRERRSALKPFQGYLNEVSGWQSSYPSVFPVLALDRIFVSQRFRLVEAQVIDTPLARLASDHLPIVADLQLLDSVVSGAANSPEHAEHEKRAI